MCIKILSHQVVVYQRWATGQGLNVPTVASDQQANRTNTQRRIRKVYKEKNRMARNN